LWDGEHGREVEEGDEACEQMKLHSGKRTFEGVCYPSFDIEEAIKRELRCYF
jgi:hypothetical protein